MASGTKRAEGFVVNPVGNVNPGQGPTVQGLPTLIMPRRALRALTKESISPEGTPQGSPQGSPLRKPYKPSSRRGSVQYGAGFTPSEAKAEGQGRKFDNKELCNNLELLQLSQPREEKPAQIIPGSFFKGVISFDGGKLTLPNKTDKKDVVIATLELEGEKSKNVPLKIVIKLQGEDYINQLDELQQGLKSPELSGLVYPYIIDVGSFDNEVEDPLRESLFYYVLVLDSQSKD
jgi:hypothetical protein